MGKLYRQAEQDVLELLDEVMRKYHRQLSDEKVVVAVLMVHPEADRSGQAKAPAVVCHGHSALAKIRLAKVAERVLGKYDALIELDAPAWTQLPEAPRRALLDHELTHLVLCCDANDETREHGDGRPKRTLQPDDYMLTGFVSVVARHGQHAPEGQPFRLCTRTTNVCLPSWAKRTVTKPSRENRRPSWHWWRLDSCGGKVRSHLGQTLSRAYWTV